MNECKMDSEQNSLNEKVVIRGFAGIENEIEVAFDKHTNLIDGPSHAVKQAIVSAIDLVLNPSYQSENVVLKFWPNTSPDSFVSVYISSDEEFELNKMDGKKFKVTRNLREDRVLVSCNGKKAKSQDIQSFHNQLDLLQFTRINDVSISEHSCPTGFDLNGTFINAMDLTASLDAIKNSSFVGALKNIKFGNVLKILPILKRRCYEAKSRLIELRTLEAAILMNEFDTMKSKNVNDSHTAREAQHKIDFLLKLQKTDNLRRRRREFMLQKISKVELRDASIDFMAEIDESINKFMVHWKLYTDDMKSARVIQWNYDKDMQMNNIKLNRRITSAEFVKDCECLIDAAQNCITMIHQNESYKLRKRLADELSKEIEDRSRAVNDEMAKLKAIERQTFSNTTEFLTLTNQMASALLAIECFSLHQTLLEPSCIESWRVGFMALTSEMAYAKQIPQDFIGNFFDFIDPDVIDIKFKMILPLFQPNFPTFFFKTESAADAFEKLVKPLLKNGLHVFITVLTEDDPTRLAKIPFTSLADYVLSEETRANNPLITNWLANIRVCMQANPKPKSIRQLAIKHQCKIIFDSKCFHEDGRFSQIFNGKSNDSMEAFLREWQLVVEMRDEWLMVREKKFDLDKTNNELKMQRNDIKSQILEHLEQIACNMAELVKNTDLLLKVADFEMAQKIEIEVNRKKLELLQEGNATPNIEFKNAPQIPLVKATDVHTFIAKFRTNAWKISKKFLTERMVVDLYSYLDQLFQMGMSDLPIFQIMPLDAFTKCEIGELEKDLSAEELNAMITETDRNVLDFSECLKELQANSCKLGDIEQCPKLIDMEKANTLAKLSLESLRDQKKAVLDSVPSDLLLPEIDADFNVTQAIFEAVEACDLAIPNASIVDIKASSEMLLVRSYFNSLSHVLKILNELIDGGDDIIGFEIGSMDDNHFMFPDTKIDEAWCKKFTVKELLDTCLTFVGKIRDDNETIVTSDLFTVKSHRFYLLLHMTLSIWRNPSVIILNKTIIDHPVDSLRKIIQLLQLVYEFDDLVAAPQFASRQIIVVAHSPNYRDLFEHSYKLIECDMRRNKAYIKYKIVRKEDTE